MDRREYEERAKFLERNAQAWMITMYPEGRIDAYHRHYEWDHKNASSIRVVERWDVWIPKP